MPAVPATPAIRRIPARHAAVAAVAAIGATLVAAAPAVAHPGHDLSTAAGLAHPFLGLDHLLAMGAVGALGVLHRRRVALPLAFVLAMAAGGALALAGVPLPGAEIAVATSVLALGVALAARRARPEVTFAMVALAGLAHGHVHGTAAGASPAAGFLAAVLVSTVALHACGAVAGVAVQERHALRRTLAMAVVGAGAGLVVAAIGA